MAAVVARTLKEEEEKDEERDPAYQKWQNRSPLTLEGGYSLGPSTAMKSLTMGVAGSLKSRWLLSRNSEPPPSSSSG